MARRERSRRRADRTEQEGRRVSLQNAGQTGQVIGTQRQRNLAHQSHRSAGTWHGNVTAMRAQCPEFSAPLNSFLFVPLTCWWVGRGSSRCLTSGNATSQPRTVSLGVHGDGTEHAEREEARSS